MKLEENVEFCLRKNGIFITLFISHTSNNPSYSLLGYIFNNNSIAWYPELLSEIEQIELGKLERNEECGLVDLSDSGE